MNGKDPKPATAWDPLLTQLHEHLRHSDSKRDQIIVFYSGVVALLLGALKDLGERAPLVVMFVAILGFVVAWVLLSYRRWHTYYVNAASVTLALHTDAAVPRHDVIQGTWTRVVGPTTGRFRRVLGLLNPLGSTEATIFNAFLVVTFLPWYLLLQGSRGRLGDCWPYIVLTTLAIYGGFWTVATYRTLARSDSRGHRGGWAFRFVDGLQPPAEDRQSSEGHG